jgi:hypothetical protein
MSLMVSPRVLAAETSGIDGGREGCQAGSRRGASGTGRPGSSTRSTWRSWRRSSGGRQRVSSMCAIRRRDGKAADGGAGRLWRRRRAREEALAQALAEKAAALDLVLLDAAGLAGADAELRRLRDVHEALEEDLRRSRGEVEPLRAALAREQAEKMGSRGRWGGRGQPAARGEAGDARRSGRRRLAGERDLVGLAEVAAARGDQDGRARAAVDVTVCRKCGGRMPGGGTSAQRRAKNLSGAMSAWAASAVIKCHRGRARAAGCSGRRAGRRRDRRWRDEDPRAALGARANVVGAVVLSHAPRPSATRPDASARPRPSARGARSAPHRRSHRRGPASGELFLLA